MEGRGNFQYVKRTQRSYSMSFKLTVVQEIKSGSITLTAAAKKYGVQGRSTVLNWVRKYGNFDRELYVSQMRKLKTLEQELLELRTENAVLKRQNAFMEREFNKREQKSIMFDAIVQVVQEDYNIDLLKKVTPEQCASTLRKAVKE